MKIYKFNFLIRKFKSSYKFYCMFVKFLNFRYNYLKSNTKTFIDYTLKNLQ